MSYYYDTRIDWKAPLYFIGALAALGFVMYLCSSVQGSIENRLDESTIRALVIEEYALMQPDEDYPVISELEFRNTDWVTGEDGYYTEFNAIINNRRVSGDCQSGSFSEPMCHIDYIGDELPPRPTPIPTQELLCLSGWTTIEADSETLNEHWNHYDDTLPSGAPLPFEIIEGETITICHLGE